MTAAPIPPAVIDGGLAAVGLLTWIMISKFVDHLPLYRLEQIAARDQPLADRLIWHLLQGNTLHADETPVSQLEPGSGKTRQAYLWAYRSNDRKRSFNSVCNSRSKEEKIVVDGAKKLRIGGGKTQLP